MGKLLPTLVLASQVWARSIPVLLLLANTAVLAACATRPNPFPNCVTLTICGETLPLNVALALEIEPVVLMLPVSLRLPVIAWLPVKLFPPLSCGTLLVSRRLSV